MLELALLVAMASHSAMAAIATVGRWRCSMLRRADRKRRR